MSAKVLIIDDEELFREDLATLLESEGFRCRTAADGESGLELARQEAPDVVLTDLMMPGISGLEVVHRLAELSPESAVIVITAFGSLDTAVDAFRKGAADYLLKPVVPEDLFAKIRRIQEMRRLEREVHYLRRAVAEAGPGIRLVGSSPAMSRVRELIERIAEAPSPVLILGDTGTGKEVVARSIHHRGKGDRAPFVAVNCAALPRELAESELFGHARGAFTGAVRDKPGVFEIAAGGTLFLDEIGEMPLDLQPKLLRAIEEQRVTRVGGVRPVDTPVRIIAATNRDLGKMVDDGTFRRDLYFRIRVVEIVLPPLRQRREDVPELVDHLLRRLCLRLKRKVRAVEPAAMRVLMAADWPGNVRELENVLERALILADGDTLRLEHLPAEFRRSDDPDRASDDLRAAVRAYEAHHIQQVLEAAGGNREEAARRLGIDPSTLYRRLKELELQPPARGDD
ncbi:MAG: sigma-54-dependent Fis family transcriptional regulator [Acidobacteria bacterium]|nr:MAG: sigma-54-dependent Fis family transcriptional regulator [Acidobacteriota bacterium]